MTRKHSSLRKGRRSIAGQLYLITFATDRRTRHFSDWDVAADAARSLSDPANWQASQLLAWVLMPDHWHGLVELHKDDSLPRRIGWVKGHTARQLRKGHPGLGKIWSHAYHDHALRKEEDLLQVSEYLLMNPVRAGLASNVGSYPFWNVAWL
jgi:Transposase and inactivated derivatives